MDLLIWVSATSRADILARYAHAAADVTDSHDLDPEEAAVRFLAWLTVTDLRWLVVLDDLTDPGDMTGLWPPESACGRTLVTTRRRDAALMACRQPLDVAQYTPSEAQRYLHAKLDGAPARLAEAEALAADLEYLPLALAQAAAYILDQGLTCASYRRRLARRRLADLAPHALPDDYGIALSAAWSLSVDLADQLTPRMVARPVLELACLLDPSAIPVTLFTTTAATGYCTARAHRVVDGDDAYDAVRLLDRLNLATVDDESGTLWMHALAQRAMRESLSAGNGQALAAVAADALIEIWPDVERDRDLAQILRANTIILRARTGTQLLASRNRCHPVLFRAGHSLGNTGMATTAVSYFEQLRAATVQHLGRDHPDALAARAGRAGVARPETPQAQQLH